MTRPGSLVACLLVAAGAFAASGCGGRASDPHDEPHGDHHEGEAHAEGLVELSPAAAERAGVTTATVRRRRLDPVLETTGQVGFDTERVAHVSARIPGRVLRVPASLGSRLAAGAPMVVLESIELGRAKAEFLAARARHELARRSFERERDLFADRISAEQEVLTAEAAYREAAAALGTAEETLHLYGLTQEEVQRLDYDDPQASWYTVRAPFAGKVVEKEVTRGELVTPERTLFVLADLSRVWIWIDVYERDLAAVHLDDRVRLEVDAYPGREFTGEVSYLGAEVAADTRTVRARIDVANPEGDLRPGMFARVEVTDPHGAAGEPTRPETLVVPEEAVLRDGEEQIVFVPRGGNRFERREVGTGRRAAGLAEVVSGLAEGEEVVVGGAFILKSEASGERLGGGHEH